MFNFQKIYDWINRHSISLFLGAIVVALFSTILTLIDITRRPANITDVKGVQHHLVWDISGNCFFVRPNNDTTNYLIAVPDCNKSK
jgi:hypothetical protein